jgi:hypothetical protein
MKNIEWVKSISPVIPIHKLEPINSRIDDVTAAGLTMNLNRLHVKQHMVNHNAARRTLAGNPSISKNCSMMFYL